MSQVRLSSAPSAVKTKQAARAVRAGPACPRRTARCHGSHLQPLPAPKTKRGERTRQKILDAAEREIGRKGFAEASISTITAEAEVGQGPGEGENGYAHGSRPLWTWCRDGLLRGEGRASRAA